MGMMVWTTRETDMPGLAPSLTDEREILLAYLAQQRQGVRNAAYGLTDDQARRTPLASSLSVGGLIKHLADAERGWIDVVLQRAASSGDDGASAYLDSFSLGPDESLSGVLADYDEVARETEAVMAALDLDQAVPVPRGAPWFPADVEAWSVRWVLLHLIEETARHAGHADLIRETLDGAKMYELMAAVEGWPDTDWLQAWKPAHEVAQAEDEVRVRR
jgi:uncharacterized damage-inducible protein DinB